MKKKFISLMLTMIMLLSLCGCGAQVARIVVNEDGSGVVQARSGWTEEALRDFEDYGGDEFKDVSISRDWKPFEYNGTTYYGYTMEQEFADLSAMDLSFIHSGNNGEAAFEYVEALDFGDLQLEVLSNGDMLLLVTTPDPAERWEMEEQIRVDMPELNELMQKHQDSMVQVLEFEFPGNVQQTGGCFNGIDVNGHLLTLDYTQMANNSCRTYTFRISKPITGTAPVMPGSRFTDVPAEAWYAPAVEFMAEGNLVSGYGDGRFGPNDSLTIAQFAQILAQAQGLETGAGDTGWWAEKALAACLERGWITDRGDIKTENYGVTIRRQEAVAAMQRASQRKPVEGRNYKLEDIPDYENICEKYRNDLVAAYNSGIVSGVDSKGTMLPLNTLTRAEICQLFYNVGWGSASAGNSTDVMALDKTILSLRPGEKATLGLTLPDGVTDSMVVWSSNAPDVVSVSRGVIQASGEGVATITAATHVGDVKDTVSCIVTVTD